MTKNDVQSWDLANYRQRKLPSRLNDSHVTSSLGKSASMIRSNEDLHSLWINILDRHLMELNSRFQNNSYGIMKAAASLLPTSNAFAQMEELRAASAHYGLAIGDPELSVFKQQLERKVSAGYSCPSLIEVLDVCPKEIFPNINGLLQILITLPITSCTVERLFSTVNRVKAPVRSSMHTQRLNSLALLSFERELTESLDTDEIVTMFKSKPRRLAL